MPRAVFADLGSAARREERWTFLQRGIPPRDNPRDLAWRNRAVLSNSKTENKINTNKRKCISAKIT